MATRGDILCKLEVHGPFLPASQRQGTRPGCRSAMHLRRSHRRVVMSSSLANRSTLMITTKSRVMPPSTHFSVQILPLPCPIPCPLTALVAHTFSIRRTRACVLLFQHVEPFTTVSVPGQISLTASQPRPFLAGVHYLVDLEALVLNPLQIRVPITHHTALNSTKVPTILR